MPDMNSLMDVERAAWRELEDACGLPDDPYRYPVVATADAAGDPNARVLVLRAVQYPVRKMIFHTDLRSDKCAGLAADAAATVVFYEHARQRQYRFRGVISLDRAADSGERLAAWQSLGRHTRQTYCGADPGLPLPQDFTDRAAQPAELLPEEDQFSTGFPHFAILAFQPREMHWLQLARSGNREARFDYADGEPRGRWVSTS